MEGGIDQCQFRALIGTPEGRQTMRTTVALDDDLVARAQEITGIKEKSALVREALRALVSREAARRLALLGGSDPNAEAGPRRRFEER